MTPQELRASILQQAIQGKLVEQRPEEGTGEELFQQIQSEKQALIKAKKIKKEKALPEISEDDVFFDIPETWRWCYVGDIFNHNTGKAMNSSAKKTDKSGSIQKFITTSNLYWDRFDFTTVKEMFFTDDEISRCSATKNDILICEGGAYYGRTAIWTYDYDICFQNHIHRLRAYKPVIERYFYYIFRFYRENGKMQAKGTAMPGLSSIALHNLIIPLPPYAEQERIVARLEEILPLIDRYETAWTKVEELNKRFPGDMQKSILQLAIQGKLVEQRPEEGTGEELFQQIQAEKQALINTGAVYREKPLTAITNDDIPFDVPESWIWCKLGTLAKTITKGSSPKWQGVSYTDQEHGILFITSENVGVEQLLLAKEKYVSREFNTMHPASILQKGDLLTNIVGASIGRTAIFDLDISDANINQAVCIIRLVNDSIGEYILKFLNSAIAIEMMTNKSVDSARANLSLTSVTNLLIPLPPLAEQKRIVAKLEEIRPLCDRLK